MREWQFNVLFVVGVGGALFLLLAPAIGMESVPKNPGAVTGVGTILAYVLTQKRAIVKGDEKKSKKDEKPEEASDDSSTD